MKREEAIKHLEDMKKGLFLWDMTELIDLCISALSENKGEWQKISPAGIYECSCCGQNAMTNDIECYKFCHGCGARMKGGE